MEHFPVLLNESLEYLAIRPQGLYVDCTAGLGGHTGAIARALTTGRVLSLDRDGDSLELARRNTQDCADRIIFRQAAFSELSVILNSLGIGKVNGILADLGVSRMQLTSPERGFTLLQAGPLDMRMDRRQQVTAGDVLNRSSERELAQLFINLGEERRHPAEKIARALVRARPIRDTAHLAAVVSSVVPRSGKLHPATRVFQALRMAVNDEQGELDAFLAQAPEWLAAGGRWVVIAFQSLDDRKVKNVFRDLGKLRRARVLTKHVVRPSVDETRRNPASRSAVLRALEAM
ncbi:MAG: 16S rRNA (cytosine(1402)-N(4))-methyltransferase RsmH [Candidatus Solibacter usitatus]|nr:16S rRNA (cytosine(1402)-N(4))-methyltransferase RsmH [Candidatus Solibacter usitatus]